MLTTNAQADCNDSVAPASFELPAGDSATGPADWVAEIARALSGADGSDYLRTR